MKLKKVIKKKQLEKNIKTRLIIVMISIHVFYVENVFF